MMGPIELAKERLRTKGKVVREALSTESGQKLLMLLLEEFDGDDVRGGTVEDTYYRLGQRDVIVYMVRLLEGIGDE